MGRKNCTEMREQAKTIASLLPALMRQFGTGRRDPVVELPLAQLRVCRILCEEEKSLSALGRELGVSQSAMTQLADRLECAGLVHRVAKPDDRRIRRLQLTRHGRSILRVHDDARAGQILAVLECLTPRSRKQVLAALQSLLHACGVARERAGRHPRRIGSHSASEAKA